jgi:UPF0755 protein
MADEPTWEDLFGGDSTSKPEVAAQAPAPAPAASAFAPQPASEQPSGTQSPGTQPSSPQVFGAPNSLPPAQVPATAPAATPLAPTYQPHPVSQPSSPLPSPAQPSSVQPSSVQPSSVQQPTAQPTYVSQLAPAPTPNAKPGDAAGRGPGVPPAHGGGRKRQGRSDYEQTKPRRKLTWLWVLIVLFVLGAAGAGVVYSAFGPQIRHVMGWEPAVDYTGTGNGQTVDITILPGQLGSDVANSLAKAGVTKTPAAFYDLLLKQKKAPTLYPGTYKLQKQMSAASALKGISNPADRVVSRVVIPEGFTVAQILARLNKSTGVPLSDLQAEAKNYTQFGLPTGAPSLEGFLFPATYDFNPGTTAKVMLQTMVTRMNQSLTSHGVAAADELKVLTLASIVQKESGTASDFYKVSRVFTNRLASGMPLQSDATVSYGAGTKTIATTAAQRADASNLYNTYAHAGLPIGPIASPGDTAIDAALHPVAGPWIYFVLVNGYTGETVFSTDLAGQDAGIKQWQAWLKAHPGYGS